MPDFPAFELVEEAVFPESRESRLKLSWEWYELTTAIDNSPFHEQLVSEVKGVLVKLKVLAIRLIW